MDITASEVTQDFLLDEYAREMIGEWNRWMTLKRFRAFESRITKANPQNQQNCIRTFTIYAPFPQPNYC
mgnify:CR=1 FL=1